MKRLFVFLAAFIWLGAVGAAQTTPVQINTGKFLINLSFQPSTAEMESDVFKSTSLFRTNTPYNPWGVCQELGCTPGSTFTVTNGWAIMSDEQHRYGTFFIDGTHYPEAWFTGGMDVGRITFQIPRWIPRKGPVYLRKPFTMTGNLRVCRINDFASGCPADQILFWRQIAGHGTLTAKMKVKVNEGSPTSQIYLQPESFEYQFEQ